MLAAGSKSRARPSASEREGKRVSPSAAMAPLTPRIITMPRLQAAIQRARPPIRSGRLVGGPPGGQGQAGQEGQGIQEMGRQRVSVRQRWVAGDVPQQDEGGTEQRFGDQKDGRKRRAEPHRVVSRKCTEGPDDEQRHQCQIDSAGDPMGELDDGIQAGRTRQHLAVAERPVLAAAGAGAGGAHEGAPQDDGDVER